MALKAQIKKALQAESQLGFAVFRSFALFSVLILLGGCEMGPSTFLGDRDREISDSTQAIQSSRNDVERAEAYSKRGFAYSEKARFSRISNLIQPDEYRRLFDLAMTDHDEAIRLNPDRAEMYFNRAQTCYDRGTWDLVGQDSIDPKGGKPWLDRAAADFEKATEKDPRNDLAFDRLGLTHEQNGESDKAIRDYTQEMALNPLGKQRLADVYCQRGFQLQQQNNDAAAVVEFQKSIEFGFTVGHDCPSDPYAAIVTYYITESHQFDKAWDFVHQAGKLGRRIQPELVDKLKKNSGRTD